MTALYQMKVSWTGTGVSAPATTTLYAGPGTSNLTLCISALDTFLTALQPYLPAGTTMTSPAGGQLYDDVTGLLSGSWGGGSGTSHVGTGTGAYGSAGGASVRLVTSLINGRHLLTGRIFLVPLAGTAYNVSGVLAPATVTAIGNAARTMVSGAAVFRVWSRPKPATTTPPHAAVPGTSASIISASITATQSVLRSRR